MISAWFIIPIVLSGISLGMGLSSLIDCWVKNSEGKSKKKAKKDRNGNDERSEI